MNEEKNVFVSKKDKNEVRIELLQKLDQLEDEGWKIIGWAHMHHPQETIHWLSEPQILKECKYYHVMRGWLQGGKVVPKQSSPQGNIEYTGPNMINMKTLTAFSIYFALWLARGETICILAYGEHSFNNDFFNKAVAGARYSIVFKNWQKVILNILKK